MTYQIIIEMRQSKVHQWRDYSTKRVDCDDIDSLRREVNHALKRIHLAINRDVRARVEVCLNI